MKRGLKVFAICVIPYCVIIVALITPMKRGLKDEAAQEQRDAVNAVALITPMKRGLKGGTQPLSYFWDAQVALITPMKRGLKDRIKTTLSMFTGKGCTNYPDEKGTERIFQSTLKARKARQLH